MSDFQVGQKVILVRTYGSVQEGTVEDLFLRRGRVVARLRFADSHFDIVDTANLIHATEWEREQRAEKERRQKIETWQRIPDHPAVGVQDRYPKATKTGIVRYVERATDFVVKSVIVCVFAGVAILILWTIGVSISDCGLADNFDYVTNRCALNHLQKSSCNLERDIFAVDEISDTSYTDDKGKRVQLRSVIYEFRKRPLNGPVSADVLRDTEIMYKDAQGHWKASCER